MKVSIVGLGYVGLPLALQTSVKGHEVIGVDKNPGIVEKVNAGESHIDEPFLHDLFKKTKIKAQEKVESSDIYVVCVPTPVDSKKIPDLRYVKAATQEIASVIEDGQLVAIESTINPGVCEDVVKLILDESGVNYLLAHCPERINPGDKVWNVSNIPRVVGGIDEKSGSVAKEFYESILDANVTLVSQIRSAEATKILENSFRDINIAFINEMAKSFARLGIDIKEVIKGASSKPFGFLPHYPGLGVGGHCIAVDPYYMIQKGRDVGFEHHFLVRAREINSGMPRYVANMIRTRLNLVKLATNGTKITVLGLSYKPGVADDRESPSYDLINMLKARKAEVTVYDPYLPHKSDVSSLKEAVKGAQCIVISTAHDEFIAEEIYNEVADLKLLVDGRNCLDKNKVRSDVDYCGVGILDLQRLEDDD